MERKIRDGGASGAVYGLGFIGAAVFLFHRLLHFGWAYLDF